MYSYYDVLGIRSTASKEEIGKAYRDIYKRLQPTLLGGPHQPGFQESRMRLQRATEAWAHLSDDEARTEHDRALVQGPGTGDSAYADEIWLPSVPPLGWAALQEDYRETYGQTIPRFLAKRLWRQIIGERYSWKLLVLRSIAYICGLAAMGMLIAGMVTAGQHNFFSQIFFKAKWERLPSVGDFPVKEDDWPFGMALAGLFGGMTLFVLWSSAIKLRYRRVMKDWFIRNRFEQSYIDEAIIASALLAAAGWAIGYYFL